MSPIGDLGGDQFSGSVTLLDELGAKILEVIDIHSLSCWLSS